ncbi:MAG TPA: 5'-3' exonuclease H3TH domain-containing protein [Myxococcota bacterium]|jgi:DNA polymerase-1|nr:5'-3' exonuclease H3TH domain-containing protein [Myxococcota bacterium]
MPRTDERDAEIEERPAVHLFDGHVLLFRAWHALPEMPAPDGAPTGAAYGFAASLLRALERLEHAAVCFDAALESFRNDLLPGYKSSRGEPPLELEAQFGFAREVTRALGVSSLEQRPYEADDLLATASEQLLEAGADVVIVTSDKDLTQLVREDGRVVLRDPAKGTMLDADGVRARFGVDPAQIPDWLALVGDAVDDLPGVPGLGPKRASALLRGFASLDRIPADAAAWAALGLRGADGLVRGFALHRERALRVRELARLVRSVPDVRVTLSSVAWRGARRELVEPLFARLGWQGIARRIPRWSEIDASG